MLDKNFLRVVLSSFLVFALLFVSFPAQTAFAQAAQVSVSDYSKQLAVIEEKVEAKRKELGIPGMALVIVKDGEVIYLKGLGYKDLEKKIAVTPDTQFPIASATKAFTALSVLMSVDDGKVSLDDSPRKHLPYFKMKDPETDKNITVRDLMDHSSGLNRTDLAMITEKLNRQELIQVVGEAQPMAKLNERFFYNNVMFAAAGEVVAKAQKTTWEKFVPERIFKPLGMNNSTMTIPQMTKAKDYSFGYEYNFDTKQTRRLPFRSIEATAPAGSINSSARDMAQWIKFVMNGGTINGKRLISEKSFEEWTKAQNKITPDGKIAYGLGWFLREWNGMKVVEHGGNIDGFNSLVAMIPEKKLGFVMLTNVSGSSLGETLMLLVRENILGKPAPPKSDNANTVAPEKEVGKYKFEAAGFDIEIEMKDGKLVAVVPGQPTYTLENVGGRKYKVKELDGFFVTFKDDSAYLEQPQGNYTLPKAGFEKKSSNEAAKELIGKYQTPDGKGTVEIKSEADGKITFNIQGQQPYALTEKATDQFNLSPLPEAYFLKVKRDAANKVSSISIVQPEGEFEFKRTDETTGKTEEKPRITVEELQKKTVEAAGGEANWRKITSRVMEMELDLLHQGIKGTAISYTKAPNKSATETTITALGKVIGKAFDFFDGTGGGAFYTFAPGEKLSGKKLEDARLTADMYALLDWKKNYKTVEIKGIEKVGDEECFAVEFTPEKGTKITNLYSTKSFLQLKRRGVVASSTSEQTVPYSITFSDYREVDGIKLPFKSVNSTPTMGDVVSIVKSVKHNVPVDDKIFAARVLK